MNGFVQSTIGMCLAWQHKLRSLFWILNFTSNDIVLVKINMYLRYIMNEIKIPLFSPCECIAVCIFPCILKKVPESIKTGYLFSTCRSISLHLNTSPRLSLKWMNKRDNKVPAGFSSLLPRNSFDINWMYCNLLWFWVLRAFCDQGACHLVGGKLEESNRIAFPLSHSLHTLIYYSTCTPLAD